MNQNLTYVSSGCAGGVNESIDAANPEQCEVALNVWAPEGRLVQRPGYKAVASILGSNVGGSLPYADIVVESPLGTFTTTDNLDALPVGDRWYALFSTLGTPGDVVVGLHCYPDPANSNEAWARVEYWNGEQWLVVQGPEYDASGDRVVTTVHVGGAAQAWAIPIPNDIASTTINGVTGYAIRFTIQPFNGSTALSASVTVTDLGVLGGAGRKFKFAPLNFIGGQRFAMFNDDASLPRTELWDTIYGATTGPYLGPLSDFQDGAQTSLAVVPQFDDAYVQLGNVGYRFQFDQDPALATVEDDPAIVGPGTRYDRDVVEQLSTWPNAKFITFFQGQLWAANFPEDTGAIMWSAPQPFGYRVWPILNIETIAEDDNSPITGLKGFGQTMCVYKNDSIWLMVDAGESALGLATYATQKIVHGVGAVSNGSVAECMGRHVFLGEDGIYAFDGTPNCIKVSLDQQTGADRLIKTMRRLNPGYRQAATAVNWRKEGCYLLAVPVDGSSYNNLVIVWDYTADAFYIWDNIQVSSWVLNEDGADNEHLYFVDRFGRIFELGVGKNDHGAAITSVVKTSKLGLDRYGPRKTARDLRVYSSNDTEYLTAELFTDDEPEGVATVMDFTDPTEKRYNQAYYNSDKYTAKRRREKRTMRRQTGNWFQVQLTHSEKNQDFSLNSIALGLAIKGRR